MLTRNAVGVSLNQPIERQNMQYSTITPPFVSTRILELISIDREREVVVILWRHIGHSPLDVSCWIQVIRQCC